ncbi:MAG: cell division ATP-binding protein FtsE [Parcubacteria group bacterium CG1_02_37_51]|uniref:Cell division ATP-binding protein FtsE n=3 Tax=Candidatus Komeiliibacteriota TaxID=1817908 RepID=A0A2M7RDC2_9BACT|nr:MAG: cell division ATP-binding protein FtsE [Parcubacteria group bacterium CG1_02_37_51]PIY94748.1 MAG: cell division ATP-binding protein FtsE [Candidatus Komeilibacteria bacterium CG_4_10_14_0_8_um_filter_37_78]
MISIKKITKKYGSDYYALKDVSLDIQSGEFVSLVGQSGTGKTTLVKLIIAEEKPTSGRIIIGGWDITKIESYEIPYLRRQIGVVFQDFKLLPKMTVYENVAFALQTCGAKKRKITDTVPQVLKIVGLDNKMDRYPHQLSGGEQQRVVIARSLVHRPKLLIADEPTGNLDSINTKEIIDLLLKINEIGTTVLLVTHNREVVNNLKKRVITIDNGEIVSDQERGRYLL